MNIAYIFGYKLSGKTKSVMAYLSSFLYKNEYENILFVDIKQGNHLVEQIVDGISRFLDIDFSIEKERKKEECLRILKKGRSILTIDFSHTSLDEETLAFIKEVSNEVKVILLTVDNFKKYSKTTCNIKIFMVLYRYLIEIVFF